MTTTKRVGAMLVLASLASVLSASLSSSSGGPGQSHSGSGIQLHQVAGSDDGLAVGILQWHSKTWRQSESTLGYSMADYGSTEAQARLTAWMFANGHAGLWSCAR